MGDKQFAGKVVLITGGAHRIGARLVSHLHEAGMNIVLHYRSSEKAAHQLQSELHAQRAVGADQEWRESGGRNVEGVSGSDFAHSTELDRLVADAIVTFVRQGVVALVVKNRDRDACRKGLAPSSVWAAVGAEGALADRQVSGVADNRELDWCHLPLLVPNVRFWLEQGVFNTR